MGKYHGKATTVLRPRTTKEVSDIVKWCAKRRIGIVPQGGNTGLVGGSVSLDKEVVLNLGAMSNVRSFDPVSGILVADAGCILESLGDYIAPHNYIMPLDLGAKGSCQIGGNIATNAGGLRLLRYGSLHGSVLGLEVVLPDGTILDQLSTLRKDNTATHNVMLALPRFDNILPLFQAVKRDLGEILSAFEYIDRTAYDTAVAHGHARVFTDEEMQGAQCFVLIETSGGNNDHDEQKITELLESLLTADKPLVLTGVLSQSPAQFASLWALREGLPEALQKEGKPYKYDISIPIADFERVVDSCRDQLKSRGLYGDHAVSKVVGWGHIGDGNLHINVIAKQGYTPEIEQALEPFIYEVVSSLKGSISAEHGIGSMKPHALHYSKSSASIEWMKKLKETFDPLNIMNPGKVLP
ncbi:hypothetical protein SERLA73DRAFT_171337 [Serpula lacrymans var. lacrymans S7.3]|uniref:FAD-binding PCMH-type domain-containing protein n=1 Tax=Serpula lacrymans var. lacrymans (strain S7.3) TaxID=936435 RepID=F8QAT5_SERL3|nr:hypothetical protein SERLA73DRAFT_171337 [Serpula lacrymans var. lacrymans S7.3]